jgi:hypothetical protein
MADTPVTSEPEAKKEDIRTPIEKVQDILKDFTFIKFDGKTFAVDHKELKQFLTPKILTMSDLAARGRLLASYNGGMSNIDSETQTLNSFLATISVGFENFKFDLGKVEDADLIYALFLAVRSFQQFFRSSPLGIIL